MEIGNFSEHLSTDQKLAITRISETEQTVVFVGLAVDVELLEDAIELGHGDRGRKGNGGRRCDAIGELCLFCLCVASSALSAINAHWRLR